MMRIVGIIVLFVLGGCTAASDPTPSGKGTLSKEPGFTAFCETHPHAGTCP